MRGHGEDGSALTLGWTAIAACGLVLVLVLDLTAYLAAAARAQGAADAAALAAATAADPRSGATDGRTPGAAAARLARAWDVELRHCSCQHGPGSVEVTVAAAVRAVAVTRFAGRTVTATAEARLVRAPPDRGLNRPG